MHEFLLSAAGWWLGTALCGGSVLLLACLVMRWTPQPAARQRVGEWAVLAALLVAVLRLGPSWLPLPWAAAPAHAAALPPDVGEAVIAPAPLTAEHFEVAAWPDEVMAPAAPDGAWVFHPQEAVPPPSPPAEPPAGPAEPWHWQPWAVAFVALYLVIAATLFGRWLLGQWALGQLSRQARPASFRLRRLFTAMAAATVWPLPKLLMTRRLREPVCFGLRRPAVMLPESMERSADETTLRWVFAHELTHLRRRDLWSISVMGLAQAIYFYLPWFWWLRRQVRLCQEYIADAAAAEQAGAADEYAAFLVSLAKSPAAPLGAAGLGNSSDLFRRVSMLLQSSTRVQAACPRRWSLAAAGGLLGVAIVFSGVGLRAEAPDGEQEDKKVLVRAIQTKDGDDKEVIILRVDGAEDGKRPVISRVMPGGLKGHVVVRLADDEDKDKQRDGDKAKEKQTAERKAVVIGEGGKGQAITITIPPGADAATIQKEVEKAIAKAKEQRAKADEERAKAQDARRKVVEKARKAVDEHKDAHKADIDKALEHARKALEEHKGVHAEEIRKAIEQARKAAEEAGRAAGEWRVQGVPMAVARAGAGRLGVRLEKPSAAMADQLDLPKDQGVVLVDVIKDSAAAKAGLKANDVLLEIDGKEVPNDPRALIKLVDGIKSDEAINAVVLRKGKKVTVKGIKLAEAKQGAGAGGVWMFDKDGNVPEGFKQGVPFKFEGGEFRFEPKIFAGPRPGANPKPAPAGKGGSKSVSVEVRDGQYTATQKDGDTKIVVKGKVNDGKVSVADITIEEPGKVQGYTSVDDVPEKHRAAVKELISGRGGVKFDFRMEEKKDIERKQQRERNDVRGTIQQKQGELATITLGSDQGVAIGNTLQVYRTQPVAEYVGTLNVLAVEPTKAVGRIKPVRAVEVRPGDKVAFELAVPARFKATEPAKEKQSKD